MAQQNDGKSNDRDNHKSGSESMTAQAGSDAMAKDAGDTASPYGTRSRNRNGSSRPNYAEDRDIDTDLYDFYHEKKDGADSSKKSSRQASTAATAAAVNGDAAPKAANSRKAGTTDDARGGQSQNGGSKDGHAAGASAAPTSTQHAGTSGSSRKRKAGGHSGGSSGQAAASNGSSKKATAAAAAAAAAATAAAAAAAAAAASASASTTATAAATPAASGTPTGISWPDTNMLTFEKCRSRPVDGAMLADDGTVLRPNDHVYLVCEPPGEPYYLGRIMEFVRSQGDETWPVDMIKINWYYRPKDIGRKAPDTRMVYATMHSDISPLTALRGKCQIKHKAEIPKMDEYRKTPDSFWYEKLYDRYIQKNYDLIPTATIVNVPANVKKVLDDRWKYVLVEQGRGKELTSAVKLCKRCTGYCASNDSVDCAVCQQTYHMNCVKPPLLKKPSRGFAWSCAACSRAQERKLEARNTPNMNDAHADADDDDLMDEDEDDPHGADTSRTSPDEEVHHEGTAEQIYQASLWPYRYLGMHCKPQDALDYDDRIYPRASTRIGPRNQANVTAWPGRQVEYVKPPELKKNGRGNVKWSRENQAAIEAHKVSRMKRPKWVQDMPPGYTVRGEDHDQDDPNCTATPLWIPPPKDVISPSEMKQFMKDAQKKAKDFGIPSASMNLGDVAMESLFHAGYNTKRAFSILGETEKVAFKEPELTPTEQKKFEEGVAKYGSELHLVKKHVKTLPAGTIVRYYYTWKKTERGKKIWANFAGRKGKKEAKRAETEATRYADDVADNDDDSAFDNDKAVQKKRGFRCQFCSTTTSRQWRRAPNSIQVPAADGGGKASSKDKGPQQVMALCRRCAELWRRYAIRWEDMEEVAKKVAQAGGRAWKRKQDEELLKELQAAQDMGMMTPERLPTPPTVANTQEPPRKKLKASPPEKEPTPARSERASTGPPALPKKKEKPAEVLPPPEPKPRVLPCAVCNQLEPQGEQYLKCRECRLAVHRNCYGVNDNRHSGKWICDMCTNDKNPQVSIQYKCVLCPIEYTEQDFVEQPKVTHHKKKMSEKDRERERLELQLAKKVAEKYRKKQEEMNRPVNPREPLKRTADNNWVHVTCAVWTPEVKFGRARALEPSEGIPSIPRPRYDETCVVCNKKEGACVSCHHCRTPYHVECARQHGHVLGFDVTPVKNSRRDQANVVTINGESGIMSANIWCKDHAPVRTIVHRMQDATEESGLNALQLYVQNFKQADLTLTGTVRKANLMTTAAKMTSTPTQPAPRRASATILMGTNGTVNINGLIEKGEIVSSLGEKVCISCGIDVSPKWWPTDDSQERELTNGHYGTLGDEAKKFVEQRRFQCHKCHKTNRTPRAHVPQLSPPPLEMARPPPPRERSLPPPPPPPPAAVVVPPMRSPPALMNHRDSISSSYAWPTHPPPPHSGPPPLQAPAHAPDHSLGPRPPPGPGPAPSGPAFPPPPPMSMGRYDDWSARPRSQHGSPPARHLNGGPPPLHGPQHLSSLRPPPISAPPISGPPPLSGPPPPAPLPMSHPNVHAPPAYVNGLPPSPRRMSGPAPPPRYSHPYHSHAPHGPPAHLPPPGLSNGGPPPRADAFAQGLHPQRPPPYSSQQGPGLPPPHEPPRPAESRPASGASASPSLRNLLS